jgi:hypothetical protein
MFKEILLSKHPVKGVSFITILADEIEANPQGITEVSLGALPLSYRASIANLCDKLYRRRQLRVTYRLEASKVLFTHYQNGQHIKLPASSTNPLSKE